MLSSEIREAATGWKGSGCVFETRAMKRLYVLYWYCMYVCVCVCVFVCLYVCMYVCMDACNVLCMYVIYRVSQEECARLREGVPYVKVYRYNPKHLYPKLNGYGDNGQRSLKL